jgi:murein L,D-transpeptidase YcbB/YkuD
MSNFEGAIAVLSENRKDVEDLINKFGGIGNVILAAPSLIRIMRTLSQHKDPVKEVERIERVLAYNNETMDKVREFQKKNGLNADGIIGNQTWKKIEEFILLKDNNPGMRNLT